MPSKEWVVRLLAAALLLPIALLIVGAGAWALSAMQDRDGAVFLVRIVTLLGLAWVFSVVLLALAGAARSLEPPERRCSAADRTEENHDERG